MDLSQVVSCSKPYEWERGLVGARAGYGRPWPAPLNVALTHGIERRHLRKLVSRLPRDRHPGKGRDEGSP